MAMLRLIYETKHIGIPDSSHITYKHFLDESYHITWYLSSTELRYHVSGPPALVAAAAVIAAGVNCELKLYNLAEIKAELEVNDSIMHHLIFAHEALLKCINQSSSGLWFSD